MGDSRCRGVGYRQDAGRSSPIEHQECEIPATQRLWAGIQRGQGGIVEADLSRTRVESEGAWIARDESLSSSIWTSADRVAWAP